MCYFSQSPPVILEKSSSRITLRLVAIPVGKDWQIIVHGGKSHVGATALTASDAMTQVMALRGHKEADIAAKMAHTLAANLDCGVCVTAGIHLDAISRDEISSIEILCMELATDFINALSRP